MLPCILLIVIWTLHNVRSQPKTILDKFENTKIFDFSKKVDFLDYQIFRCISPDLLSKDLWDLTPSENCKTNDRKECFY